ncbi:MAG: exonuclease SbcCD subunit D C-terminal domain-containing protein [Tannerella sp.]|nr:exonuclease SbcCD subunit D C-terminal domain-containing protein [Tannerella sp.]
MRILHTADWHLGQNFYGFDRKREHVHFLTELKRHLREQAADVLLVAGDVFDSPNPPAEAQEMFYRFLYEATVENAQLQIVVIAGNHDSAARLEAPDPLLQTLRVTVRGSVRRNPDGEIDCGRLIIPLVRNGKTVAWCLAVPYLRFGDYPPAESYATGVAKLFRQLYGHLPDKRLPIVAMGHLQATGSEISVSDKSERTVIGGLEGVAPEELFQGVAYAALGHLHRAQRVSKHENIRYAGAPLPMSFAETGNRQRVARVEIDSLGTQVEWIELSPLAGLQTIRAVSVQDVFRQIDGLPDGDKTDAPYLEIRVRISDPEPSLRYRIECALENKAVRLGPLLCESAARTDGRQTVSSFEELQNLTPMGMALEVFRRQYDGEMPEEMKTLLQQVIDESQHREVG